MEKNLFKWHSHRGAGVLVHPSCLPNQYKIGNFGACSRNLIDLLVDSGMKYWQILPLGPTGYGSSPYQAYSSHAIEPCLMDLDDLLDKGWVQKSDLLPVNQNIYEERIHFDQLKLNHEQVRQRAVTNGLRDKRFNEEFQLFKSDHSAWLQDYALFMTLKNHQSNKIWSKWKKDFRDYENAKSAQLPESLREEMEIRMFEQFVLFRQWMKLKAYANDHGIEIIGDIPIYVAPDSVDIWSNRSVFKTTKNGGLSQVAGVPPDYFNENGQFWGNPLYDWKELKATDYDWWIDRLGHSLKMYDIVRFDHFRALASYWSIPAKAESAKEGKWIKGPGLDFFKIIKNRLPDAKIILEDLGEITDDVIQLKDQTGCPGLAVLQFAFGGGADNFYLPHNVQTNTVIYTGTHDNDTSLGWYHSTDEGTRDHLRRYLQVPGHDAGWDLIRAAYRTTASTCMVPVQDILGLDSRARMNTPGVPEGNWGWRMHHDHFVQLRNDAAPYLASLAELYGRN